jgi:uncharacterized protein (TIGR00255 family)
MVNSMTGYGRATNVVKDTTITVEIKSVNHRYSDISVRMPKEYSLYEEKIKKVIQSNLHRGRIEAFISIEGDQAKEKRVNIDTKMLKQYIDLLNSAAVEHSLSGELTVNQLLHIPDLFSITEEDEDISLYEETLLKTVLEATNKCTEMRKTEGAALLKDMIERIHSVKKVISDISQSSTIVIEQYRERLKKRIEEFIGNEFQADESRLLTEVAVFAEKADISEELTRLSSHCEQFVVITSETGAIGRKLDFLVQEMNRETNTIGAKANDYRISQNVVVMKSELEKIKEQVQNIE